MFVYFKCIFVVILFLIFETIGVLSRPDEEDENNPYYEQPNKKSTEDLKSNGIFVRFLRNLLDLLTTTFPDKKLPRYFRILYHHMIRLEFKYTKRLAKHLKYLGHMYREDLRNELKGYRDELDKKLPRRTAFLNAMNEIFTARENLLFDDYIYELRNFGNEDIISIEDETRKLLNDVIVGRILKQSITVQDEVYQKLRKAYREYNSDLIMMER